MERYKLDRSSIPGKWVCADTLNGIVLVFEEHKFNETQQITFLEDLNPNDFMKVARLLREMADWLHDYHHSLL